MPTVRFTSALQRFFPSLTTTTLQVDTIADLLHQLETHYPGLRDYLVDEQGVMRKHVNIYIGENLIQDRDRQTDRLQKNDEVLIFQALSGG
jgi:molybdopterin synthase sulfur carrier subunit